MPGAETQTRRAGDGGADTICVVTITSQGIRAGAGAKPYELTGFPFGSAVLPPSHRAQIDQLARRILASWSTARPVRAIRVVGHTNPVGTDRANMALGQRRAEAVRRELLASLERYRRGSSGQLQAQAASRGELDQVPGPAALNRRVQLFFFAAPGPVTTTSGPVKATSPFTLPADPGNCLWPALAGCARREALHAKAPPGSYGWESTRSAERADLRQLSAGSHDLAQACH